MSLYIYPYSISLQSEPDKWGNEEVCQWLDLVGFGSFKQAFKERRVTGYMLLHMDVKLFGKKPNGVCNVM